MVHKIEKNKKKKMFSILTKFHGKSNSIRELIHRQVGFEDIHKPK